jgi:hypothetical protein
LTNSFINPVSFFSQNTLPAKFDTIKNDRIVQENAYKLLVDKIFYATYNSFNETILILGIVL